MRVCYFVSVLVTFNVIFVTYAQNSTFAGMVGKNAWSNAVNSGLGNNNYDSDSYSQPVRRNIDQDARRRGNESPHNSGVTYRMIGDRMHGSDGTVCYMVGQQVHCDKR